MPLSEPLSAEEVRVLGVLAEKQLSTPDYYPMTTNALTQGCNQKTNRDPVVQYSEGLVQETLDLLIRKHLAGTVTGASMRTVKYRHALTEAFRLTEAELAVLAVLLLRGPQTLGEVRSRTTRLHAFETLEEAEAAVEALRTREEPLVVELERQPGQKEARFAHLLAGEPEVQAASEPVPLSTSPTRLQALEEEVAQLRAELDSLRADFTAFRAEFE